MISPQRSLPHLQYSQAPLPHYYPPPPQQLPSYPQQYYQQIPFQAPLQGLPPTQAYNRSFIPMAPGYIIQPVPVIRRHPQADLNMNFDYESANFLCEQKLVENSVYCVICGSEYKASDKDKHLERHQRKKVVEEIPVASSYIPTTKTYKTRPIVEPEECYVKAEPTVYNLVTHIDYQDQNISFKEQAIG